MSGAAELRDVYDVAVVGAGPAGMAAAAVAARAGLATVLLDENPGVGGQIFRAITASPHSHHRILGEAYWSGQPLVRELRESGASHVPGATVWSLSPERELGVSIAGRARMLSAKRIILATGALERPFPIPGWTLPGVMTVGAAQTLLKASGLLPSGRTVLVGCGPLLWLLASQLLRAGVVPQAILDTTPAENRRRSAFHAPAFIVSPYLRKGLALLAAVRRKVRVIKGVTALAVEGDGRVESVVYTTRDRAAERMPVDTLLLHQGVVPNVNLAMSVGIEHRWDDGQLAWLPVLDGYGMSGLDGIAIAGDGAGIGGARVAEERGRLCAIAAVRAIRGSGAASPQLPDEHRVRMAIVTHERGREFLDALYRPADTFRVPAGDTIVCRCEEVTARQIVDTVVALGCEGPNQLKTFLRCGMGPCQGRLCGLTVTELIAATRGVAPSAVGYYRLRPPVKPLPLGELAAMATNDAAVKSVVRA